MSQHNAPLWSKKQSRTADDVAAVKSKINTEPVKIESVYNAQVIDRLDEKTAVMVNGQDKAYKSTLKQINCKLPQSLITRLDDEVIGSRNTAMIALLEYALDALSADKKALLVQPKEKV